MRNGVRGRSIGVLLALVSHAGAQLPAAPHGGGAPRPNVVVILTDDQRFDTVGLEHSRDGVTPVMPNVERLASKGVTFQNSFTTTALCGPSRASLLAGRYAHSTGVKDNHGPDALAAFDASSTIAVWLHDAGYTTALVGKYINGYEDSALGTPPGWDEWRAFKKAKYFDYTLAENGVEVRYGHADADYSTDVLAAKAVRFIRDHAGARPFFLYFAPFAPHVPATPAPRHRGMFAEVPPWRPPNFDEADVSDKPLWVQNLPPWNDGRVSQKDGLARRQLECLQSVDEAVGAIVQALEETGVARDTFVLFASDNGYSWGAHRWEPKECPYQECMRVPLVVRAPALVPAARVDARVALNIDYAPTIAELAGATPGTGVEGTSLVRLLDGSATAWRTDFLEEHWGGKIPTFAQVHGSPWTYTEYVTTETELYDQRADPFELRNVAGDPGRTTLAAQLAARLRELRPDWPVTPATLASVARPASRAVSRPSASRPAMRSRRRSRTSW